jgi:hypothetical protein
MVGRVREIRGIIARKHVRKVQIHRQRILQGMVDGARRATTASSPGSNGKDFPLPGSCQTTVTTGAKSGKMLSPVTGSRSTQLLTEVLLYGDRVPKQRLSR